MSDRQAGGKSVGSIGLVALALVFLVGATLINATLRGVRLDLTENRLYTLSDGTRNILAAIPEPVNVYLYFSDRATTSVPFFRTYATRVREMLEEFAGYADGKLVLTVVDPVPFSEEEDRAAGFGLQAINLGTPAEPIYFGVAGTNSVGENEVIPFLDPTKEAFLEYDLAKLVYALANPAKPRIALLSSLPMTAGFDPMTQQIRQPWVITDQLRQLFDLQILNTGTNRIDDDVRVLMLVHPRDLPDTALYAIDQFVLRGGNLLVFVDPVSETDPDPGSPAGPDGGSNLEPLFRTWGILLDEEHVVADDQFALNVRGGDGQAVRHLTVIGLDQSVMSQDDVVTGGLNLVNMAYPGHLIALDDSPTTLAPLIQSSAFAGLIPVTDLLLASDPAMLREGFAPTGTRYTLAARIQGTVPSAFPNGRPDGRPDGLPGSGAGGTHLAASTAPINVVVVADTDLLADRLWVQSQDFFGQRMNRVFANNGDLAINALDNLLGSSDLISIRSRATFQRPFTRVQELRRQAETRFQAAEQRLQDELDETESRLAELQVSRPDQGTQILSAAQQAEIDRFQARRLELRRELRQVQRGLDQDIERLGGVLKAINIGLVPLLISVISVLLLVLRRRRTGSASP